jgi:hypothetical protein
MVLYVQIVAASMLVYGGFAHVLFASRRERTTSGTFEWWMYTVCLMASALSAAVGCFTAGTFIARENAWALAGVCVLLALDWLRILYGDFRSTTQHTTT